MSRVCVALVLVLAWMSVGCDEGPKPPAPRADVAPTPPKPVRATTQEIISAPRRAVQLGSLPLSISIPSLWTVQEKGPVLVFGPAPSGDVQIGISRLSPPSLQGDPATPQGPFLFTAGDIQARLAAVQAEAKENPQRFRSVTLENRDSSKVLEVQINEPPKPSIAGPDGQPLPALPAMYRRETTIFVPEGQKFIGYRMILEMPLEQYNKDQPFIQSLLSTLRHDPTLPAPKRP